MNYAQAVKANRTRAGAMRAIQCQAETELGRRLNETEVTYLLTQTTVNVLLEQIEKVFRVLFLFVLLSQLIVSVWVWFPEVPDVLVQEASPFL